MQTQFGKISSELTTASGRAEQYRKDNEELNAKIKKLESDCSRYVMESGNLNKTIESYKTKIKELNHKLNSKSAEENTTLAEYRGQTDEIINELKKQLTEKEELVIIKGQQTNEAQLELERLKKYNEVHNPRLINEITNQITINETTKNDIDAISEELQKSKSGIYQFHNRIWNIRDEAEFKIKES